ncbi:MAG: hypothetical protein ABFC67_01340 [Mizugakiibacter sp.]|uniref:hypothetical protein n=1 Tax=Mizugakiibacter sp. TaxID=1972610 RepID=UPI0031BF3E67|nr:hypothetical protein [Xanthomonadaceae bacterium]
MNLRHALPTLVLALALPAAYAGDYALADGGVRFSAPSDWNAIMEKTEGDPQFIAFQVRDPSPSAADSLARVTVSARRIANDDAFAQYVRDQLAHAKGLSGYQPAAGAPAANRSDYSATESKVRYSYSERYYHKGMLAVQLRCVRPAASQAGPAWAAAFDRGCDDVAVSLQR